MTEILFFVATAEHGCSNRGCKKQILVGERAVKSTAARPNGYGERMTTTLYYHENCWPPGAAADATQGRGENEIER